MGKWVSDNFTKNYFDGKCMKCPICTQSLILPTPTLHRAGWGKSTTSKLSFVRKYIKCPELQRNVMFVKSRPHEVR